MPRNRIRKTGTHHHKFMLAFAFGSTCCPAYRVVQAAQLAFGAGIHVAHSANYNVRLVVQVQTIGNQFVQIDFGWPFTTSLTRAAWTTAETLFTPAIAAPVSASLASSIVRSPIARSPAAPAPILPRRPIFGAPPPFGFLLFNFRHF